MNLGIDLLIFETYANDADASFRPLLLAANLRNDSYISGYQGLAIDIPLYSWQCFDRPD